MLSINLCILYFIYYLFYICINNFYPVMSYRTSSKEKESDELLYTVLVTRYGPRTEVAHRRGVNRIGLSILTIHLSG